MKHRLAKCGRGLLVLYCVWVFPGHPVAAETLVDQLLERYGRIDSVTGEVRRDMSNADGQLRWLSRVYFLRPDRLHVENISPLPRRIISDGTTMYQHNEGHPRGFRKPIVELDEGMRHGLRKVPGTLMEHLFRLEGLSEEALPPGTGPFPERCAYDAGSVHVVLHVDEALRLGRVEFYADAERLTLTGEIDCEGFVEVLEGVWIPMHHRSRFIAGGRESRETTRISNYHVNQPIPGHLFNAEAFFHDVNWVSRFEDL